MRRILAVALFFFAALSEATAAERLVKATLLVFSDIYEMDERNGRGGFARVSAVLKAERAKAQNTLVAFAGDTLSPSLLSSLDKGAHIIELFNLIGVDVFTPGNHEFDFGDAIFRARMGDLQAPRLAANLRDGAGNPLAGFSDSKIIEMDGVRLGVFGLTEDEAGERSNTEALRISPAIETARREAQRLREAGADLIVAVTHSEWKDDLRLAKTGLIDVILSGHDHNLFVAYDGRTAIAETQADGAQVVAVDLAVSVSDAPARKVTWTPKFRILDTADVAPDPVIVARASEIRARLDKGLDEPIGVTQTELDGRKSSIRTRETALGDFIADAMREATRADVAILNGGAIRGDAVLAAGATVTRKAVLAALPFANRLVTLELSGADLRAALESAYGALGRDAGRFAQISGARLALRRDAIPGSRLASVDIGGAPLDETRVYRVATNDYLANGKDGYDAFLRGKSLVTEDAAPLVSAVVIEAIRRTGALAPRVDGRIAIE